MKVKSVSPLNFDWIRRLVEDRTGNLLDMTKSYLADTRLASIAGSAGQSSIDALITSLRAKPNVVLERQIIEALLTYETSFFRDPHYFDELATTVLPELFRRRQRQRRLHIWCAACASGQEAYSIAMLLREQFVLENWDVRIVATDYSRLMLDQARRGVYSEAEVRRGMSPERLQRFFQKEASRYSVHPTLKPLIEFHEINLATDRPPLRTFDLVLIRNVLIYLSESLMQEILDGIHGSLAADGCLVLGSTESLIPPQSHFSRTHHSRIACFQPVSHER